MNIMKKPTHIATITESINNSVFEEGNITTIKGQYGDVLMRFNNELKLRDENPVYKLIDSDGSSITFLNTGTNQLVNLSFEKIEQ